MVFNSYKTYPMAFDVWCKLGVNMVYRWCIFIPGRTPSQFGSVATPG